MAGQNTPDETDNQHLYDAADGSMNDPDHPDNAPDTSINLPAYPKLV